MTRLRLGAAAFIVALAAAACSSAAGTAGPNASSAAANQGGGANLPAIPAGGNGSCSVDITGAVTKSWTTQQNMGSLEVSQWLSQEGRTTLGLAAGEEQFILNCQSDSGSVDLGAGDATTEAQFPVQPASYVIPTGLAQAGQIAVLVNLHDSQIWKVSQAGTFNITTFGGSKFAGSFSFTMQSDTGTASVSGTFDLSCTSDACS